MMARRESEIKFVLITDTVLQSHDEWVTNMHIV